MQTRIASLLLCLLSVSAATGQAPAPTGVDRIRIAEAFRLADAVGIRVRPEWDKAPFAMLLVTNDHEFLIRQPKPSDDFKLVGEDDLPNAKAFAR